MGLEQRLRRMVGTSSVGGGCGIPLGPSCPWVPLAPAAHCRGASVVPTAALAENEA